MGTFALTTTAEILAYGEQGDSTRPNIVTIESDVDALVGIGVDASFATLEISGGDTPIRLHLVGGDTLWGKALAGVANVTTTETRPKRGLNASDVLKKASSWFSASDLDLPGFGSTAQSLRNRGVESGTATMGSTSGSDANDPLRLPHNGEHYVYIPGSGTNTISVPDEAALDIVGDIDLRADVALDDYASGAVQTLVAKTDLSSARSYALDINSTGNLRIVWSVAGSSDVVAASTATLPAGAGVVNGSRVWVRATLDVDNGASGYDATFYTSVDGITWTMLGDVVVGGATTSIFASSTVLRVGAAATSSNKMEGKVYRAQVWSGIGGTKVLDIHPTIDIDTSSDPEAGQASFTATTGQTVTVNRSTTGLSTEVVTDSIIALDESDDYIQGPASDTPDFSATAGKHTVVFAGRWAIESLSSLRIYSTETSAGDGLFIQTNAAATERPRFTIGGATTTAANNAPGGTTLADHERYCTAVVVEDGGFKTFLNGQGLSTSTSITGVGTITHGAPRIGGLGYAVSSVPRQTVQDVLVFKGVALTADELEVLATALLAGGY